MPGLLQAQGLLKTSWWSNCYSTQHNQIPVNRGWVPQGLRHLLLQAFPESNYRCLCRKQRMSLPMIARVHRDYVPEEAYVLMFFTLNIASFHHDYIWYAFRSSQIPILKRLPEAPWSCHWFILPGQQWGWVGGDQVWIQNLPPGSLKMMNKIFSLFWWSFWPRADEVFEFPKVYPSKRIERVEKSTQIYLGTSLLIVILPDANNTGP